MLPLQTRQVARAARSSDEDPAVRSPATGDDDFGGMDWRTFRAKLVAQSQALRSVSGASQSQQSSVGLEIWQVRGLGTTFRAFGIMHLPHNEKPLALVALGLAEPADQCGA